MRLPKSFKQLTIAQYLKVHDSLSDSSQPWLDKYINTLVALTGKPHDYFLDIPIKELKDCIATISFISQWQSIPDKLRRIYIINGRAFKLTATVESMTGGQYIDWTGFSKISEGDYLPNIHNLLATVLIPVKLFGKTEYDGNRHKEVAEWLYSHMSMYDAYPIMLFFSRSLETCIDAMQDYLHNQLKMLTKEAEEISGQSLSTSIGDGSPQ